MKSKDGAGTAYDRLRAEAKKARKLGAEGDGRQWTLSAGELFELMDAMDSALARRKELEEMEGNLYAVYETGRQKGLDVARWLAGELSRNRILVSQDKCSQCGDYGAEPCRACWMEVAQEAVKKGRGGR